MPFPKKSSIVTPIKKPKKVRKLVRVEKTPEKMSKNQPQTVRIVTVNKNKKSSLQ